MTTDKDSTKEISEEINKQLDKFTEKNKVEKTADCSNCTHLKGNKADYPRPPKDYSQQERAAFYYMVTGNLTQAIELAGYTIYVDNAKNNNRAREIKASTSFKRACKRVAQENLMTTLWNVNHNKANASGLRAAIMIYRQIVGEDPKGLTALEDKQGQDGRW